MPIDDKRDTSLGTWTPHPEFAKGAWNDKDADEWYCLRALTPEISEHIDKQSLRPVKNPQTRAIEMQRDDELWRGLVWDHLIQDWRLKTLDGADFPCTLDNKLFLAKHYGQRTSWIVDTAILYANDDLARRAAEQEAFRCVGQAAPRPSVAELYGVPEPT